MPTLAEMAVEREVRDAPMVALINAGRTIRQIADELKLNPNTVRHRATAAGLTADASQAFSVTPTRPKQIQKPCHHGIHYDGACKTVSSSGHRFGADTYCSACGTSWYVHQRYPVECPEGKRPERVVVEKEKRKFCSHGHPWVDVYVNPAGKEQCRVCMRRQGDDYSQRKKEGRG